MLIQDIKVILKQQIRTKRLWRVKNGGGITWGKIFLNLSRDARLDRSERRIPDKTIAIKYIESDEVKEKFQIDLVQL